MSRKDKLEEVRIGTSRQADTAECLGRSVCSPQLYLRNSNYRTVTTLQYPQTLPDGTNNTLMISLLKIRDGTSYYPWQLHGNT